MTPIALLHLATGTAPTELERDEQVALAWSLAGELWEAGTRGAYERLVDSMPTAADGPMMRVALWLMAASARRAYATGQRELVAACFGVRGRGW